MLKGLSIEEVQKMEAEASSNNSKTKWIPKLGGLKSIGDKTFVQFVGIKGLSDLVSYKCHTVHIQKKDGNLLNLTIPCLNQVGTEDCPLCRCTYEGKTTYKNGNSADWKESDTSIVTPLLMIDLNKKFDKDKGAFVSKTDFKDGQIVDLQPMLVQRLNSSKRFRAALEKLVASEKTLENKVVCIEVVRYKDEKGKESNKGTALDMDYSMSICPQLQAVDTTQFEVPENYPFIDVVALTEKTAEEMDRYNNTHSFFEKKNGGENTETPIVERPETPSLPEEEAPAVESLDDLPGVSYRAETQA